MMIKPKTRSFICLTAHPIGCEENVHEQIDFVKNNASVVDGMPKNALIIGSSTGYGLASRIVLAFCGGANTIGVYFGKAAEKGRTASAGWYNSVAFKKFADEEGLVTEDINGDAFSQETKTKVADIIRSKFGKIDCVIYSIASPRRVDPVTGEAFKSVLKPIGEPFMSKTVNVDTEEVMDVIIDQASDEEIFATKKVMGGEDWELWIKFLHDENLLSNNFVTVAYSYVGPKVTWPIYYNGTIGVAKDDLMRACEVLNKELRNINGRAVISVNKAVVTQASAAIPVVPLYLSVLFKIMKKKRNHEGCIEQMTRLFTKKLYGKNAFSELDENGRIRLDEFELSDDVQSEVDDIWTKISTENIREITDIVGYKEEFLKLFGFSLQNVDYDIDVDL